MKRIAAFLAILALTAWATPCPAQEPKTEVVADYWLEISFQGQKIGYEHHVVEMTQYNGISCYKTTSESSMRMKGDDENERVGSSRGVSYEGMDFTPLYSTSTRQEGPQKRATEVKIENGKILIKKTLNDDPAEETTLEYEKGVVFGAGGFILKQQGHLKVGETTSFKCISTATKSFETATLSVVKEDTVSLAGTDTPAFLIHMTESSIPGITIELYVDGDGIDLKGESWGLVMNRTTEAQATNFGNVATLSMMIKTNVDIPFVRRIARLNVVLTLTKEAEDVIPACDYHEVSNDGRRWELNLKAIPAGLKEPVALPIKDESVGMYLEPSVFVQSGDPVIAAKAKEIAGTAPDGLAAARLLCKWVFDNIKEVETAAAYKSAKETLADRKGTCTEHAALFCALARANGIPTRVVAGLIYCQGVFGYHAWNEVYLGKWIPADSTRNWVGIPATYIRLGEQDDGDEESKSAARMAKLFGKVAVDVRSFVDTTGNAVDVTANDKRIAESGDNQCSDAMLGMRFTKPDGWKLELYADGEDDLIGASVPGCASAVIRIIPWDTDAPLKEALIAQMLDSWGSSWKDEKRGPCSETKVGGCAALACVVAADREEGALKFHLVIARSNDKTYCLCLKAGEAEFEKADEFFKALLQSIKF